MQGPNDWKFYRQVVMIQSATMEIMNVEQGERIIGQALPKGGFMTTAAQTIRRGTREILENTLEGRALRGWIETVAKRWVLEAKWSEVPTLKRKL